MGKAWLWAADNGGCGWYRTVIVGEALRKRGHDVGDGVMFDGENYSDAEAVLGQRIFIAGSSTAWSRWNFFGDKRTVFDADDDYFHMHQHPEFGPMVLHEYGNSRNQARILANAASSTYTTCASQVLAEMFNVYCSNVVMVPNGLPERYLERKGPYERPGLPHVDPKYAPIVGWAGSSFTQSELTDPVKDVLSKVGDWGARLHTVGVPYPVMRQIGLAKPGVAITGWVDCGDPYYDTIDFDVWVAPYRRTDYNEAKFATKALEAAFLGIPLVASDTTPYRQFIRDGETGFLVEPGGDWETPIKTLINDPQLREKMGRAAREVARDFTIERLAETLWEPILFGSKP